MQNRRLELIFQITSYLISYLGHLHTARLNRFPYKQVSSFEEKFSNFNTFLSFQISLYQCDNYIVENNELSIYQTQNGIKLFI